jgi:hypothetical protein
MKLSLKKIENQWQFLDAVDKIKYYQVTLDALYLHINVCASGIILLRKELLYTYPRLFLVLSQITIKIPN